MAEAFGLVIATVWEWDGVVHAMASGPHSDRWMTSAARVLTAEAGFRLIVGESFEGLDRVWLYLGRREINSRGDANRDDLRNHHNYSGCEVRPGWPAKGNFDVSVPWRITLEIGMRLNPRTTREEGKEIVEQRCLCRALTRLGESRL
ncbi:hypothetical protein GCM10007382_26800 [Salinibacterium xinjiangense]|nr:hypothetical protein GCM10007382_26800 [Salinibacterium xinjiangense]